MESDSILTIYLALLALYLLAESLLISCNLKSIRSNAGAIPAAFAGVISPEKYQLSLEYSRARGLFDLLQTFYSTGLILVVVLSGALGWLDALVRGLPVGSSTAGVLFLFVLSLILRVFGIPFELYETFKIEERFGFNRMTWKLWLVDAAKELLVGVLLLAPLLYILFWLQAVSGPWWWLYAAAVVAVFQLGLLLLYPVWIAPFFNKFLELTDGELKSAVTTLAKKIDFKIAGVFKMDGSRRSAHSNAYFTGMGKHKRIVLYDTLVNDLSIPELIAVLAHEMGHQKLKHLQKGMLLSLTVLFAGFWVLGFLADYEPFFAAFGLSQVSFHGALFIFILASGPVRYFLVPVISAISRRFEYAADLFAVQVLGTGVHLSRALVKLAEKNLSNLTPHRWYSTFHYSHPTLLERLRALEHGTAL